MLTNVLAVLSIQIVNVHLHMNTCACHVLITSKQWQHNVSKQHHPTINKYIQQALLEKKRKRQTKMVYHGHSNVPDLAMRSKTASPSAMERYV